MKIRLTRPYLYIATAIVFIFLTASYVIAQSTQHSLPDFQAGTANNVDTSTSPIKLSQYSYLYRKQITLNNTTGQDLQAGHLIEITEDTVSLIGKMQINGDDLRIFFDTGSNLKELPRYIEGVATTSTNIYFRAQDGVVNGSSDNNYYLVYGNSEATNPPVLIDAHTNNLALEKPYTHTVEPNSVFGGDSGGEFTNGYVGSYPADEVPDLMFEYGDNTWNWDFGWTNVQQAEITIDLGEIRAMSRTKTINIGSLFYRGVKDVEILTSTDNENFSSQATMDGYDRYFDMSFSKVFARYIKFRLATIPDLSGYIDETMMVGEGQVYEAPFLAGTLGLEDLNTTTVYNPSGILESQPIDSEMAAAKLDSLSWETQGTGDTSQPAGTGLKFQVAGSSDNVTWTSFKGPDGTRNTYFTTAGGEETYGLIKGKYFKYKVYLSTDNANASPYLNSVNLNYSARNSYSYQGCTGCHTRYPPDDGEPRKTNEEGYVPYGYAPFDADLFEAKHETQFDDSQWPDLNPNCQQGGCHQITSPITKKPNLWQQHLGKQTTTYNPYPSAQPNQPAYYGDETPGSMGCGGCHMGAANPLPDPFNPRATGGVFPPGPLYSYIKMLRENPDKKPECKGCHGETVINHEPLHNTKYLSSLQNPSCAKCHPMESTTPGNEGNPNLWNWHIGRKTTSYPDGMNCQSCHNYQGTKLNKEDIWKAMHGVNSGNGSWGQERNTDCNACHKEFHLSVGEKHDTTWTESNPVNCQTCHNKSVWPRSGNPNLWPIHLGLKTKSFPFMDCDSCHNYGENILNKENVKNAVWGRNTKCGACHENTMHNLEVSPRHRTNYEGDVAACTEGGCHTNSRPPQDTEPNLQDLHITKQTTSYSSGMNCDSCHDYNGSKLNKELIDNAIALGGLAGGTPNTICSSCHPNILTTQHSKPAAPTMNTAQALSRTSIRWYFTDNSNNETGFKLFDSNGVLLSAVATPNVSNIDEEGLAANTQYTRYVRSYNTLGDSEPSNSTTRYTLAIAPDVTANKNTSTWYNTPDVTFANQAGFGPGGVQGYQYSFNQSPSSFQPILDPSGNLGMWTSGTMTATASSEGEWYLHILAFNGNYTVASDGIQHYGPFRYDAGAPVIDSVLNVSAYSSSQINLSWNAASNGAAGYKVERADDNGGIPGTFSQIATTSSTSYSDTGLTANSKYWYRVRAYDQADNNSDYTENRSATTLADAPAFPVATDGTLTDQIEVSWVAPLSADHYNVYKDGVAGVGTLVYSSNGTSFIDNLSDTNVHNYYIYSANSENVNSTTYISDTGYATNIATIPADQALALNLSNSTYADSTANINDITANLSDDNLVTAYDISIQDPSKKAVALKINREATQYSKVVLRFYVANLLGSPTKGRIYAYNSNANSLNTSSYIQHTINNTNNWNEVDVTSLKSKMNGFGWMKFRMIATQYGYKISEARIILTP